MTPGPGAGAAARAQLVPWYTVRPRVLSEDFLVIREGGSLEEIVGEAGTLKGAVEVAQEKVAADGGNMEIVHLTYVRVGLVGEGAR